MVNRVKAWLVDLVLGLSLAAPVAAGPLEDATAAYHRGDYAKSPAWRLRSLTGFFGGHRLARYPSDKLQRFNSASTSRPRRPSA